MRRNMSLIKIPQRGNYTLTIKLKFAYLCDKASFSEKLFLGYTERQKYSLCRGCFHWIPLETENCFDGEQHKGGSFLLLPVSPKTTLYSQHVRFLMCVCSVDSSRSTSRHFPACCRFYRLAIFAVTQVLGSSTFTHLICFITARLINSS